MSLSENDFELLCKDGSRRPVNEYLNCNWGKVTSDAIVSSSAKSSNVRKKYQAFLQVCTLLDSVYMTRCEIMIAKTLPQFSQLCEI